LVLAGLLASPWGLGACSLRAVQLPRVERYDFGGKTLSDVVQLRQIIAAEAEGADVARYALARTHAEWLVLALVQEQEQDQMLRFLAMDLGVPGANPDDRLSLAQVRQCVDAVRDEVRAVRGLGGQARAWARGMERLLVGVHDGWATFSPDLFLRVAEQSGQPGPIQVAADLLVVGWSRLVFQAMESRPAGERALFVVRMAGFVDAELVAGLADGEALPVDGPWLACAPEEGRRAGEEQVRQRYRRWRSACSGEFYGLPAPWGELISPELFFVNRVLADLSLRRRRLELVRDDPLVNAAGEVLGEFDAALERFRLPMPLPVPGPSLPDAPLLADQGAGEVAAVVVVLDGRTVRVAPWPTMAWRDGQALLAPDSTTDWAWPGRVVEEELLAAVQAAAAASDADGDPVSVAVVASGDRSFADVLPVVEELAQLQQVQLSLVTVADPLEVALVRLQLRRGAGREWTEGGRRALVVLRPEGLQVAIANGAWHVLGRREAQESDRLHQLLAEHLRRGGRAQLLVAAAPQVSWARLAQGLLVAGQLPQPPGQGEEPSSGQWDVWVDPAEPPAPRPAARTVTGAVARHRARLRSCYERYLRAGGLAQGAVVLEMVVRDDGTVREARLATSELGRQPALDSCLLAEAQRIRFPAAQTPPTVRLPLRFVPR
jgi:hypothetical protein